MLVRWKKSSAVMIGIAFFVVMVITVAGKINFHVDELLSYNLSNARDRFGFEEGRAYAPVAGIYLDKLTVSDAANRFDFALVWENQKNDVHPPLYYLLLNAVCSIYVGKFSVWYAGGINICFALLTLYVWRKLIGLFCNDRIFVEIASILFALSVGVLQSVSFLRMYVMAMFWVTLTAYLLIKSFDEGFSWKQLAQIGGTAIAGALTHYYCIIYLCAVCLVLGICLIMQKRWGDIVRLGGCMLISAGVSVSVFPAMLAHMFLGQRGTKSMDNMLHGTMAEQWDRIKAFYQFINVQMLGKIGEGVAVFSIFIIAASAIRKNDREAASATVDGTWLMRWLMLGIPQLIYFLFVSMSAVFVSARYLFPIYAVVFGLFLCMVNEVWKKIIPKRYMPIVLCLLGTALTVGGFKNATWSSLCKASADLLHKAQAYSDRNCISVYDVSWKIWPTFCEMRNYKSVTFFSKEHCDQILQREELFADGFLLNVIGGDDDRMISLIQKNHPYLNQCEKIGGFDYSVTYYISAGD